VAETGLGTYFKNKAVSIASSQVFFLKTARFLPLKIGATIAPPVSTEEGRIKIKKSEGRMKKISGLGREGKARGTGAGRGATKTRIEDGGWRFRVWDFVDKAASRFACRAQSKTLVVVCQLPTGAKCLGAQAWEGDRMKPNQIHQHAYLR